MLIDAKQYHEIEAHELDKLFAAIQCDADLETYYNNLIKALPRRVQEFPWFFFAGEDDELATFLHNQTFTHIHKGGKDVKGKHVIFLHNNNTTISAVRCDTKSLYRRALEMIYNIDDESSHG